MPGSIVFRPIEANLTHNTELLGKMDPYVQFVLGTHKLRSNVCKKGGKHPMWEDSVTVPSTSANPTCLIEIKDKDLLKDDRIGAFELDLREVEAQGSVKKWFPIFHKDKPAGEILMEAIFTADSGFGQQGFGQQGFGQQMSQPLGGGLGTGLGTGLGSGLMAPHANYTAPLGQSGGMMGSVPLQTQGATPSSGGKSLSEQFAEEALLRGIDPLHSHSTLMGSEQPLPTGVLPSAFPVSSISGKERNLPVNEGMGGGLQSGFNQGFNQGLSGQSGLLGQPHGGFSQGISNVPLGQTGLLPAQGGFIGGAGGLGGGLASNLTQQANNAIHTVKDQHAMPMQHGQFTPVGTGLGSDYLTNNVVASNMGGLGHHTHHDQKTFGHGHHDELGTIVKEGLNPTTQGPKGTANMETFDRKVQHF